MERGDWGRTVEQERKVKMSKREKEGKAGGEGEV